MAREGFVARSGVESESLRPDKAEIATVADPFNTEENGKSAAT